MLWALLPLLGLACKDRDAVSDTSTLSTEDLDGDGFSEADGDCNDSNPDTYPGALEACDGLDQDCDAAVDEDNGRIWYLDADGDGYGDPDSAAESCTLELESYVLEGGDCSDRDPLIHPDASEVCDGVDNDCDGEVDDGLITAWYMDADGDGYGDPAVSVEGCEDPGAPYVDNDFDCDDSDPLANDLGLDDCDGRDNDCDGLVDESPETYWYLDADDDGFGDPDDALASCTPVAGRSAYDTDCDDSNAQVSPAVTEVCDGVDNDCDGGVDVGAADMPTWFKDSDGDGHGVGTDTRQACIQPATYSSLDDDCDDSDATISPSATEWCDAVDNDCDGETDEDGAADASTYYADSDEDGYGDPDNSLASCTPRLGYVSDSTDCDDGRAETYPGADEICDLRDNDCDGTADDSAIDALDWYADTDGDGVGDSASRLASCTQPSGYVSDDTDCDDSDISTLGPSTWYSDSDGDGYGSSDSGTTESCTQPSGYTATDEDCDDVDSGISPAASETCDDGVDDDCDGEPDDGCAEDHCGNINSDETWEAGVDHSVSCDVVVRNGAVLTIEDGVSVYFDPETALRVGTSGSAGDLVATGTTGVTLSSNATTPAAGDWDGLDLGPGVDDAVTDIEGLLIEYAGFDGQALYLNGSDFDLKDVEIDLSGGHGVLVDDGSTPEFDGVTITDCADDGIYIKTNSGIDSAGTSNFINNSISGCGGYPVSVDTEYAGEIDSSNALSGNDYDYVRLWGGVLSTDLTLALLDVDFLVDSTLKVQDSTAPVLTIEDGVTVAFESGQELWVGYGSTGGLYIDGSTTGVTFTSAESSPAAGDWGGVSFSTNYFEGGSLVTGLEIAYAGGNGYGGLHVSGSADASELNIHDNDGVGLYVANNGEFALSDSTIQDNTDDGVYVIGSLGGDDLFTGNTVTGNGDCAISLPADEVGDIASDNSISGNGTDAVCLTDGDVDYSATWADLGVPIQADYGLRVSSSRSPILTLEDGVEIEFGSGQEFFVGKWTIAEGGSVEIEGTSTGVTLTSSQSSPAAGDWEGLRVWGTGNTGTIEGLTVEYAGASGAGCLRAISGADLYVDDSTVQYCLGSGIYVDSSSDIYLSDTTATDAVEYAVYAGGIGSWSNNTLTNSGMPLFTYFGQVARLDAASSYTGNTTDWVEIGGGTMSSDATIPLLDADYLVSADVEFNADIQVEAGCTFYHDTGVRWYSNNDSITATGTASAPITFTSSASSPAQGDWTGFYLHNYTYAYWDYVTVEYAGQGQDGAVYISNSSLEADHVTLSDSSSYGWYYVTAARGTRTNMTYTNNAWGDHN